MRTLGDYYFLTSTAVSNLPGRTPDISLLKHDNLGIPFTTSYTHPASPSQSQYSLSYFHILTSNWLRHFLKTNPTALARRWTLARTPLRPRPRVHSKTPEPEGATGVTESRRPTIDEPSADRTFDSKNDAMQLAKPGHGSGGMASPSQEVASTKKLNIALSSPDGVGDGNARSAS